VSLLLPKKTDFDFTHKLRVRWSEIDMQKVVFNAHYLAYFDCAVADIWRDLSLPYERSLAKLSSDMYVKKALLEYHGSAMYDDVLEVCMRCEHIGRSSITFKAGIFKGDVCLVSGEMVFVYVKVPEKVPHSVPQVLRDVFQTHKEGHKVVDLHTGEWSTMKQHALPLRLEVFVEEQGVPLELEQDEFDEDSLHAVLLNCLGDTVATARLLPCKDGVSKIGRMCVSKHLRGTGLGQGVLQSLIEVSRSRGDQSIELHAQLSAAAFYSQAGFKAVGETFSEAGIEHQAMVLKL
jgi:YbgC/YbaW family acyl-CoA thioester hydrolase